MSVETATSTEILREQIVRFAQTAPEKELWKMAVLVADAESEELTPMTTEEIAAIPASMMPTTEQLIEELAERRKTPRSEYLTWEEVKARLIAEHG